jgi:hypothetical protein
MDGDMHTEIDNTSSLCLNSTGISYKLTRKKLSLAGKVRNNIEKTLFNKCM